MAISLQNSENTVYTKPGLSNKISQVNCWYCVFFLLRIHLLLLLMVYDASFAIELVIQKSRRKNIRAKHDGERTQILLMFNHLDRIWRFKIKVHYITQEEIT